jgi:hypothetical protein
MKVLEESETISPRFLNLDARWMCTVSLTNRQLYPQGKSRHSHWLGGWLVSRADLNAVENY